MKKRTITIKVISVARNGAVIRVIDEDKGKEVADTFLRVGDILHIDYFLPRGHKP